MDKARTTPKDFFLWAGAMVALYGGVVAFITLVFSYIDYVFPEALTYWVDPYAGMSYQMAALIVLAPVFLILMRLIRRDISRDASRGEIWIRRWALFLTVFVAGATIVIDLITLLTTFLSGEDITVRFLLKVAIVLLVAAAGLMHFLADIWGFWAKYPARAHSINWAVGALVVATIIAGFFIIGTPQQARQYRLDQERVNNLQDIQWQIVSYWQRKETLPDSLSQLNDPLTNYSAPVDPATGATYIYKRNSPLDFALCATFARESRESMSMVSKPTSPYGRMDSWQHGAGEVCFDRSIDPDLYPPVQKPTQ